LKHVGNGIPDRNPSLTDDDQRSDRPALGAQCRHEVSEDRPRVHLYRACRQTVGDDERDVVTVAFCMLRKRRLGT
jgi:hypothetical protein